ncbi:MAG: SpoIIE family protein phosphatase [Candidatus Aminicenantes bacterium]|nr:SpoIIE family protein phosphatase [Candidatus Aminicenantes bacterium]
MFSRWKKIDFVIAILFVLTNISYLLLPNYIFKFFLWALIITAVSRLLLLFKRKLLWRIRNRLIFSGLFIVAAPIFFILIFFYFTSYILIAHYEVLILNNIMDSRLLRFEHIADNFLDLQNIEKMKTMAQIPMRFDQGALNILFFKWTASTPYKGGTIDHREGKPGPGNTLSQNMNERGTASIPSKGGTAAGHEEKQGEFSCVFEHPTGEFPKKKLAVMNFKGYFMLNNRLYHGVIKQKKQFAVLIANTISQEYLDDLSTISDFKIKYRDPYDGRHMQMMEEITSDPELMSKQTSFLPYFFDYKFLDFNTLRNNKPSEESGRFLLKIDFNRLYDKVFSTGQGSAQDDTLKFIILLIVLFAPIVVFSFFIGFRMIRVITRSINQITKGTQKIRNGDFSFRIKTRSKDELQYLGESFNEMAAGIDRLLVEEKEKQRLEEELRIARSIQLRLLPPDTFESEKFELAAVNIPAAEIAGDYFDYFFEKENYLSLLVADVSGKGAPAAFYMAELKGLINHLHKEEISPADLIAECHSVLSDSLDKVTFITMIVARFVIPRKKFVLSRAGHTQALFYSQREKKCLELFPEGVAIGLINFSREKIKEIEVEYHPGDILFLFSDGLSEILNKDDEMIGVKNLKRIICNNSRASAGEIKQKMLDFAIKFSDTEINRDDLTFIVLKVK